MKLVKLITRNFRSFYGIHEVVFSDCDEKRVTIFHGENGSGKTTLLNAVYWCVTGRFTPRFSESQYVVNKDAFRDGIRECHIELYFTDEDKTSGRIVTYRAVRTGQNQNRSTPLKIFKILEGNSVEEELGEAFLRKLIPDSLVDWFFFDAEAIGTLELSGSPSFKSDLNRTLGFEFILKLLDDLNLLKLRKQKEISSAVKNKDLEAVQKDIENYSNALPAVESSIKTTEIILDDARSRLQTISERLRGLPKSEPLERERRDLQREREILKEEILRSQKKVRQLVGESAPSILLAEIAEGLKTSLRMKEEKARLPSPWSDVLVNQIIDDELCLCGREVKKDSQEAQAIKGLLKFATTGELTRRVNQLQYFSTDPDQLCSAFR
jgi:DNA sulfur modification protein DndD